MPRTADAPVPAPAIAVLKDLCLTTALVKDGRPAATLVAPPAYAGAARRVRDAVRRIAGATLPIVADTAQEAAVPFARPVILFGNRSTNRAIGELYNRYFTLLDLRHPGPGGWEVRTLHNPFGNGANAVFIGGSDDEGVEQAAAEFVRILGETGGGSGTLTVGWIMRIRLGTGLVPPDRPADAAIWEAAAGYGSIGYFGWNSISKCMALYYMTGEPRYAREFIRRAFPDEAAKRDLFADDGERIEDKDDPLAGPYHYNAHLMILFWDLIEESPVFTPEERLRVTRAFARQLFHSGTYGANPEVYTRDTPAPAVGDRHTQWLVVGFYCICRYFDRDYPHPLWTRCLRGARMQFASLDKHHWVTGESGSHFWHSTSVAPILTFLLLDGAQKPLENGVVGTLLRAQEILFTGNRPDWTLQDAGIDFFHKAAHLTQDGRWLYYRDRAGVETGGFRLGQSFWPEARLAARPPADTAGDWMVHRPARPEWRARRSGVPFRNSFHFASVRTATDDTGDFLLLAGVNGFGRNYFHVFNAVEARAGGVTLLRGYRNQVQTRADGIFTPRVSRDGALLCAHRFGGAVLAAGRVERSGCCRWTRTILFRLGEFLLFLDELRFPRAARNVEAMFLWESPFDFSPGAGPGTLRLTPPAAGHAAEIPGLGDFGRVRREIAARGGSPDAPAAGAGTGIPNGVWRILPSATDLGAAIADTHAAVTWRSPAVRAGEKKAFFTLLAREDRGPLSCAALGANAARLALPGPGVAWTGAWRSLSARVGLLTTDRLLALDARRIGPGDGGAPLISADEPVTIDWSLETGEMHVIAARPAAIRLACRPGARLRVDGRPANAAPEPGAGLTTIRLPAGKHLVAGTRPRDADRELLDGFLRCAEPRPVRTPAAVKRTTEPVPPAPLLPRFAVRLPGPVTALTAGTTARGVRLFAAAGSAAAVLSPDGDELARVELGSPVQALRWWQGPELLLVGCFDGRVVACDASGRQRWAFASRMDPAVLKAAKDYWFNTQPGHEGVRGLFSGVFLDGKEQAFVGSACTLEILGPDGGLVRRLPVFWGPGRTFALLDGPGGERRLLIARKPACSHAVAVLSSRALDRKPEYLFHGVPPGHTAVGVGFGSTNTERIIAADLEGDGRVRVATAVNGSWNRVAVWETTGRPLFNAQFGPGMEAGLGPAPDRRTLCDLDAADIDGDGRTELIAAHGGGMVVALDGRCRPRWSVRLPAPALTVRCGLDGVLAGCGDRCVRLLDPTHFRQREIVRLAF